MKKLISILLIVTMLTLSLCSCELKDKITDTVSGWFGNKEEETTTAVPQEEETTTKPQEEETTTKPQEEETTTKPAPWAPGASANDDKKPIELPGIGIKPTVGQ